MAYEYLTSPRTHQVEALKKAWGKHAFAFFMDMGTGKTKVIIDEASALFQRGHISAVVVLCLNGAQQNWVEREIGKHCPIPHLRLVRFGGWKAAERKAWERVAQYPSTTNGKLPFFCSNIEMLRSKTGLRSLRMILDNYDVYLAVDESQIIKSPTGSQSKALIKLAPLAKYRRIATGTATPNAPLDLWAQFQFLDPEIFKARLFPQFKARFAVIQRRFTKTGNEKMQRQQKLIPGRDYFDQITGYKKLNELKRVIEPHMFAVRLNDVEDMPPLTYSNHYVDQTPQQKRMYKELLKDAATSTSLPPDHLTFEQRIIWLVQNADVVPSNALTKSLRLQTITQGHVKTDDGTLVTIPSNSLSALYSLLDATGEQSVIVWAHWRHDIDAVTSMLTDQGISHVRYDGTTSAEDRSRAVNDFQMGEAKVFVGQPSTAGVSLTLTRATQVIWYSFSFKAGDYAQANRRPWRIGQDKPVHVTNMIGSGTLQREILATINEKIQRQDEVMYDEHTTRDN
jgi:SNF2 family DNA or RNA helicase